VNHPFLILQELAIFFAEIKENKTAPRLQGNGSKGKHHYPGDKTF